MTMIVEETTTCALCGSEAEFTSFASASAFGSPDLDTRPPEMCRSTMFAWVQRCTVCGYCASAIDKTRPGLEALVKAAEYRRQLTDHELPELANTFLCQSLIQQESKDYAGTTWALIHAAWACDDAELSDKAAICRDRAANMLITAEQHGQQIAGQDAESAEVLGSINKLRS